MELKLTNGIEGDHEKYAFNCTLWNWNISIRLRVSFAHSLLIVPYGIETVANIACYQRGLLLIVPYGIETANSPCVASYHKLLIVPYGIETSSYRLISISWLTFNCTLWNWNNEGVCKPIRRRRLLIVPYGIETRFTDHIQRIVDYTFNCTLWNWNS